MGAEPSNGHQVRFFDLERLVYVTDELVGDFLQLVSGATLFFMQRFFRHREEGEKKKDETAKRENILILKSVSVIGKLTMANAIAIRDGRTNGELHAALEDYDKVNRELYDYLLEQNANK